MAFAGTVKPLSFSVFVCISVPPAAALLVAAVLVAPDVSPCHCCLLPSIQRSATVSGGPVDR